MSATENRSKLDTHHPLRTPMDLKHQLTAVIDDMTEPEKRNILELIEKKLKNEKRERQRRRQSIKTEVAYSSRAENGIIENLSPGGAFLSVGHSYPAGSEVTLSFPILNFEFPVKLKAEVIWISSRGMGLKFKSSQKLDYRLAAQKLADAMGPPPPES